MSGDKKKIGRPPLNDEIQRGKPTRISLPLYERIQERRQKTYRTQTGEINALLEWALDNIETEKEGS